MRLAPLPQWRRIAEDNLDDLALLIEAHGNHIRHRAVTCPHGHLRTGDAITSHGDCLVCRSASQTAWRQRRRARLRAPEPTTRRTA